MKEYSEIEIEVVRFSSEDVIVTSITCDGGAADVQCLAVEP